MTEMRLPTPYGRCPAARRLLGILLSLVVIACLGAPALGAEAGPMPVRVLRFRLELNRMFPTQVTVPEGTYTFQVNNPLVLGDLDVYLHAGNPQPIASKRLPRRASKVKFNADLRPGKYTLQVSGAPMWRAEVTVLPSK